jgi:DNA-binding LytR/AlgR family response regulator
VEDLQNTPVAMISWLQGQLLDGQAVMVRDIGRLPRAAGSLKAEFIRQGNRSVFCVPVFAKGGELVACIGFDAVIRDQRWEPGMAANLAACAELIALAWERHEDRHGLPEGGPLDASPAMVYLHQGAHVRGVPVSEIIGITAEKDYTRVHVRGMAATLELRPLKAWLDLLPKSSFQRIHRGAIVNMAQVASVERATGGRWRVHLSGLDEAWSVSKAYRADVRSRLGV